MRQCLPPITASPVDLIIDWLIDNYPKAPAIEPGPSSGAQPSIWGAPGKEAFHSSQSASRNIRDERLLYFEWMNLPNCSHFSCRFACRAWTAGEGRVGGEGGRCRRSRRRRSRRRRRRRRNDGNVLGGCPPAGCPCFSSLSQFFFCAVPRTRISNMLFIKYQELSLTESNWC